MAGNETFEIILLDPIYYPTPTGDGEIIFQYYDVNNSTSCTVGIENATEDIGFQYLYRNSYIEHSEILVDGRAIKFTTNEPGQDNIWLVVNDFSFDDSTYGNNNGLLEHGENIILSLEIFNNSDEDAFDVDLSLSVDDSSIEMIDFHNTLGRINAGETISNVDSPFLFVINDITSGERVNLDLDITANDGEYHRKMMLPIRLWFAADINENIEPQRHSLNICYPNPFNSSTTIEFESLSSADVYLEVFDLNGNKVYVTQKAANVGKNTFTLTLDQLPSGVYFYNLQQDNNCNSGKIVLIK